MQTHDQSCRLVSYEKNISALVKRGLLIRWRPLFASGIGECPLEKRYQDKWIILKQS